MTKMEGKEMLSVSSLENLILLLGLLLRQLHLGDVLRRAVKGKRAALHGHQEFSNQNKSTVETVTR